MATNHTANYGLHVWEPTDDFLREEFNENFGAIDGAIKKANVVIGSYTGIYTSGGSGAYEQTFELGFRPRAVLAIANMDGGQYHNVAMVGVALDGVAANKIRITDTGFAVGGQLNYSHSYAIPYRYIAWR